jgi:hypothetical protein
MFFSALPLDEEKFTISPIQSFWILLRHKRTTLLYEMNQMFFSALPLGEEQGQTFSCQLKLDPFDKFCQTQMH